MTRGRGKESGRTHGGFEEFVLALYRRSRWVAAMVLGIIAVGIFVAIERPWARSEFWAEASLKTDSEAVLARRHVSGVFSGAGGERPLMRIDFDLPKAAGGPILLEVHGDVHDRGDPEHVIGYVACSARIISSDCSSELEMSGLFRGCDLPFPAGPIGVRTYEWAAGNGRRFFYTAKGPVWNAFEAEEGDVLSVSVIPVICDDVEGRPERAMSQPRRSESMRVWRHNSARKPNRPPDVFIYLVDALRPDHLGCYGYERGTSPHIDEFAEASTLYESAFANSSWTRPSVAALVTGLHPSRHATVSEFDVLPESPTLLSEALRQAGYATFCITTNPNTASIFGFNQGYDKFVYEGVKDASWVNVRVAEFLASCDKERPVFAYIHTMEPHAPYQPSQEALLRFDRAASEGGKKWSDVLQMTCSGRPEEIRRGINHLVNRYDAEVFDADRGFADFLEILQRTKRFEQSLIIFLADHGEAFREHGMLWHGNTLCVEEIWVPLIVRYPVGRFSGERIEERVRLVDVFPTVLAEVGIRANIAQEIQGERLPTVEAMGSGDRIVHCQLSPLAGGIPTMVGVIDGDGYKRVIASCDPGQCDRSSLGLWDTTADPTEARNLVDALPVRAAYDEQLIGQWLLTQVRTEGERVQRAKPDEETRRRLRALGYLQ